jgi:hypothetical protein
MEEIVIYESTDGGHTIYARRGGSDMRELVAQTCEGSAATRWLNFKKIIETAQTNRTLEAALQQVELIYQLTKND